MDRAFIGIVVGGPLIVSLPTLAQQELTKPHRIGYLGTESARDYVPRLEALRAGLRELGYVEGKNIIIDYRWADGRYDRLPGLAADLLRLDINILVTASTPGTRAAKQATTTVPIVMVVSGDAVGTGLVTSLARPGGNVTGTTFLDPELSAKRLQLIKEAVPHIAQIAVLSNPSNPQAMGTALQAMQVAARSIKVALRQFDARKPNKIEGAFSAMSKERVDAVAIPQDAMFLANSRSIAELAAKQRLPSIAGNHFADAGGLMGYGVNIPELFRRAGVFVDKILKGAKPADIPVEQATKFVLTINLKTAKALGLTIPHSLLLRADEVIQ